MSLACWPTQMPGYSKFGPVCAFARAAGVKCETCVTFAGGGREGAGWTEEISFWNKTWAALKKDDFLWGVVCNADLPTDHEEREQGGAGAGAIDQRRAKLQGRFRFCKMCPVAFWFCKPEPQVLQSQDHLSSGKFRETPHFGSSPIQINSWKVRRCSDKYQKLLSNGSRQFFPVNKSDFSCLSLTLHISDWT